jgi:endonuclease/exonuclease/phosphatase family metal-dependent hydrolase
MCAANFQHTIDESDKDNYTYKHTDTSRKHYVKSTHYQHQQRHHQQQYNQQPKNKDGKWTVITWNAGVGGLRGNIHFIEEIKDADIIVITETRTKKDEIVPQIRGYPYTIHHSYNNMNNITGGVSILSKQPIYSNNKVSHNKCATVITTRGPNSHKRINILCAYISPSCKDDTFNNIIGIIDTLNTMEEPYIIIGDFNAKHNYWDPNFNGRSNDELQKRGQSLYQCVTRNNLIVNNNTDSDGRIRVHTSNNEHANLATPTFQRRGKDKSGRSYKPSVLDLVITNKHIFDKCVVGHDNDNILVSDHLPVRVSATIKVDDMKSPQAESQTQKKWDTNSFNTNKYKNYCNSEYTNIINQLDHILYNGSKDGFNKRQIVNAAWDVVRTFQNEAAKVAMKQLIIPNDKYGIGNGRDHYWFKQIEKYKYLLNRLRKAKRNIKKMKEKRKQKDNTKELPMNEGEKKTYAIEYKRMKAARDEWTQKVKLIRQSQLNNAIGNVANEKGTDVKYACMQVLL